MSARRRLQPRDRRGRFTSRLGRGGRLPGWLRARLDGAALGVLALTLAALRSELARRLGRLALLGAALAAAVLVLYQHGDTPAALAHPAVATAAPAPPAKGAATGAPAEKGTAAPATRAPAAGTPAAGTPAARGRGAGAATAGSPATGAAAARGPAAAGAPAAGSPAAAGAPATPSAAAGATAPSRPADVAAAWFAAHSHLPPAKVRALQQDVVSRQQVRVLVLGDRGNGRLDTALVTVRRDRAGRWSVP